MEICSWLTPIMNVVHGTNFSSIFWTRLLSYYAQAVVNQFMFFEREYFDYPVPFQPINGWAPPHRRVILKDQLITLLRSMRGEYSLKDIPSAIPRGERISLGVRAKRIAKDTRSIPLSIDWVRFLGMPDRSVRQKLLHEAGIQSSVTACNICKSVPKIFVEYFGVILGVVKRAGELPIREIFVEHYSSQFDVILTAYLSEARGVRINQLQTGGFVGETVISVEPSKRVLYDRLLTYGWRLGCKDEPYYAVRLEEFKDKYVLHQKAVVPFDILVVYGNPENSRAIENHYRHCTKSICSSLDHNRYPNILLRPRATSRVLRITKFPSSFKGVARQKIDKGRKDMAELCASATVVIQLTMPSTNFLECVFIDKPVLGVDTNLFPTEIVKPFLDFFHECGVLHNNIEALIAFLNGIDLQRWWFDVISEARYKKFKELFARSRAQYLACMNIDREAF